MYILAISHFQVGLKSYEMNPIIYKKTNISTTKDHKQLKKAPYYECKNQTSKWFLHIHKK